jgi:hypothetical protein
LYLHRLNCQQQSPNTRAVSISQPSSLFLSSRRLIILSKNRKGTVKLDHDMRYLRIDSFHGGACVRLVHLRISFEQETRIFEIMSFPDKLSVRPHTISDRLPARLDILSVFQPLVSYSFDVHCCMEDHSWLLWP